MLVTFYLQTKYKWCSICPRLLASWNSGCGDWPPINIIDLSLFPSFYCPRWWHTGLTNGYKVEKRENTWDREVEKKQGKEYEEPRQTQLLNDKLGEEIKEISLLSTKCNDKVSNSMSYDFRTKFFLWWCFWVDRLLTLGHVIIIHNSTLSHRIPEWLGLERTSGDHLFQAPAKAASPRAGGTGLCPAGCWMSPGKDTPQPLWAK